MDASWSAQQQYGLLGSQLSAHVIPMCCAPTPPLQEARNTPGFTPTAAFAVQTELLFTPTHGAPTKRLAAASAINVSSSNSGGATAQQPSLWQYPHGTAVTVNVTSHEGIEPPRDELRNPMAEDAPLRQSATGLQVHFRENTDL